MSVIDNIHDAQYGWRLLTEYNLKLRGHYQKQARTIFTNRNRLDHTVVLDPKPQASTSDYEIILATVRSTLNRGAAMRVYKPYIDILQDLGEGLTALDILDPLLHDPKNNISVYPEEYKKFAHPDYCYQLMYVRLLTWAREVSPLITHPELASFTYCFEDLLMGSRFSFNPPESSSDDKKGQLTSDEQKEQLRMLYDCVTHTVPGSVCFYNLLQCQSPVRPVTPRIENMKTVIIIISFLTMTDEYRDSTAESLPLTRTYSWYPKPIDELLPIVFRAFISKVASHASNLYGAYFNPIIPALHAAVRADIRVARSMPAECVAAILSAAVNRVCDLTTSSFPLSTVELQTIELLLYEVLGWIRGIFFSLSGRSKDTHVGRDREVFSDDVIYSDDAKSAVVIANAIKPVLLHALTTKINPAMYAQVIEFVDDVFCMQELPDEVPMSILSKSFWTAITAVLTVPFDDGEADAVRLHHSGAFTVELKVDGKEIPTVLKTAQEWNSRIIAQCCSLLYRLCGRGMVTVSKFNVVGKTLLKRGVVQLLYQQDALHPDKFCVSFTLGSVLNFMARARDGRLLLLHASELGCRFSCIELLRHYFLHSHQQIVDLAFRLCQFLIGDEEFHPLILAMDPAIEDIMAKWASLRIFHIIRRAEEKYQRLQIKHQLELLCRHSGVDFSSINFSSWSIGKDFLDSSSSDLLFRRYAAHLPIDSAVSEAGCFVHILLTICDLSAMMSGYQTADRLRRRKLVGLIASLANTPANSLLHTSSLRSLKKLLECGSFSPSDLLDPYRQISDLTDIIAVNTPHEIVSSEDGLQSESEWDKYLVRVGNDIRKFPDLFIEAYDKMFPSLRTPEAPLRPWQIYDFIHKEHRSPMLLQLKKCASGSCGRVELNSGEYKTCSKCHRVWYCSIACQTADWKRHRKTDCLSKPLAESSSSSSDK